MTRFAMLALTALLAACATEVENDTAAETNQVDNLFVENLIITDAEVAGATEAESQPAAQAAPAPGTPAARATPAQPKEPAAPRPAPAAEPKAPAKT
ncbi:MAG TPA: hypothetical protein VM346_10990, partial [Sphingomicrobium sp.]|nr:hypothetical protein [Sphingomicrobium sp.]